MARKSSKTVTAPTAAPVAVPLFGAHINLLAQAHSAIVEQADAFAARPVVKGDASVLAEIDSAAFDNVAIAALKLSATQRMSQALLRGAACGFDADTLKKRALAAFYRADRVLAGFECSVEQAMQDCADKAELDDARRTTKKTAGQNVWRAASLAGQVELKAALECDKLNGGNDATQQALKDTPCGAFYKPKNEEKAAAGAAGGKAKAEKNPNEKKVAPADTAPLAPVAVDATALLANYKVQCQWVARFHKANAGLARKDLGEAFIKAETQFRDAARALLAQVAALEADQED